jgi:exodeoxyribonuclease VII large subunit
VSSLIDGISYFNKTLNVDVIILGRGGGSGEDLSAFNDELLARTIFESHIPIISGVGHETDTSICDYVADLRAPTPSAAAELAVPDINEYLARLNSNIKRANGAMNKQIEHYDLKLRSLSSSPVLKRPMHYLEERQNELAFFEKRIESAFIMKLKDAESAYLRQVDRLKDLNPMAVLSRGFSIVRKDESVVTSASDLKSGDRVALTFSDGTVNAVVE